MSKRIEHVDGKKQCCKCKIYKPFECFGKDKSRRDGLQSQCKDCRKEYSKKWRKENPEYNKEWDEKNPKKNREYSKKWREKNPEKSKEYSKKHYKKPALFETYAHQLIIDDKPMKADDGIHLLVICKTCYNHFQPTNLQVKNRIQCLNGNSSCLLYTSPSPRD